MTTLAQRISETPMAPYAELLRKTKRSDMQIVVTFLQEAMEEAEERVAAKSNRDIIREKFKHLHISADTKQLVEGLTLSEGEMQDERTQYILGKK